MRRHALIAHTPGPAPLSAGGPHFPVDVPPLGRRREDIPPLVAHLVKTISRRMNREEPLLTRAALMRLQAYDWPGNVRELQDLVERALITSRRRQLAVELPDSVGAVVETTAEEPAVLTEQEMRRFEKDNLRRALLLTGGKVSGPGEAAELLGLRPTTLASRIRKLGIG